MSTKNTLAKFFIVCFLLLVSIQNVLAQDYSLSFLYNGEFESNLGYWYAANRNRADSPQYTYGTVEWTEDYGGSAHLSVSGAPSEVSLISFINTTIYPGDKIVCRVYQTDMDSYGAFWVGIGGDWNDFYPAEKSSVGGEHDLTLTANRFYLPGTCIRIWLVVWPGSGEAWVEYVHLQRGGQVSSVENGNSPIASDAGLPSSSFTELFPNPSNSGVKIGFDLIQRSNVNLNIYNSLGRKIRTIQHGSLASGHHEVFWDGKNGNGSDVASGMYFYQLAIGDNVYSKKSIMLR